MKLELIIDNNLKVSISSIQIPFDIEFKPFVSHFRSFMMIPILKPIFYVLLRVIKTQKSIVWN